MAKIVFKKKRRKLGLGRSGPPKHRPAHRIVAAEVGEAGEAGEELWDCYCGKTGPPTAKFSAQCGQCNRWIHGECSGYQAETDLPRWYTCIKCRGGTPGDATLSSAVGVVGDGYVVTDNDNDNDDADADADHADADVTDLSGAQSSNVPSLAVAREWQAHYDAGRCQLPIASMDPTKYPKQNYWWTYFSTKSKTKRNHTQDPHAVVLSLLRRIGLRGGGHFSQADIESLLVDSGTGRSKRDWRAAQLFVTGDNQSTSPTHTDETDSTLIVLRGFKTVWLHRPGDGVKMDPRNKAMSREDPCLLDDTEANDNGWSKTELRQGQALIIPKGWWHQVKSTEGSLALSLVLRLGKRYHATM